MDNAAIHHGNDVVDLIRENGFQLEYLPPYSPDYNPIEMTFNTLKIWLQRHFATWSIYGTFDRFLGAAVSLSMEPSKGDFRPYYRKCGYL
nr:hypothetical protein CFP56_07839 [Quercus suber]